MRPCLLVSLASWKRKRDCAEANYAAERRSPQYPRNIKKKPLRRRDAADKLRDEQREASDKPNNRGDTTGNFNQLYKLVNRTKLNKKSTTPTKHALITKKTTTTTKQ